MDDELEVSGSGPDADRFETRRMASSDDSSVTLASIAQS